MFIWLILTVTCSALFFCMALFPEKWASLVSAENAYFTKKGWISESLSQKFVNIETSIGFQIVVAIVSVISFYNLAQ